MYIERVFWLGRGSSTLFRFASGDVDANQNVPGALRTSEMEDRWLSITEICEYFGVSNDTVYNWIDKNGMPAHRMGRLRKFGKTRSRLGKYFSVSPEIWLSLQTDYEIRIARRTSRPEIERRVKTRVA